MVMARKSLPMLERPVTRGDCRNGVRPCPFVSCVHNLLIDVLEDGSIVINAKYRRPDGALRVITPKLETDDRFLDEIEDAVEVWFDEPDPPAPSCSLDEADGVRDRTCVADTDPDKSGMQLDEIAELMYVSRERVRQVEAVGLAKLKIECEARGITLEDFMEGWLGGSDG